MIDRRIVKYKLRRGTDAQRLQVSFDEGEMVYTIDKKRVFVGDGATTGGIPVGSKATIVDSLPSTTNYIVGDMVFVPGINRTYMMDGSSWVFIGPAPDEDSIDFNSSSRLSITDGGVRVNNLNTNVVDLTGGVGLGVSGLYVNFDPAKLKINTSGQLSLAGPATFTLDPDGGLEDKIAGIAINVDNTTLKIEPKLTGNNIVHVGVISAEHIADSSVSYVKLSAGVVQNGGGLSATSTGIAVDYNTTTLTLSNGQISVNPTYILNTIPNETAVPAGTVIHFAGMTPPTGYLAADGSAVSRTTYSRLSAVIGEMYGPGDGSTTFNLPDLRGYFVRGSGTNGDGTAAGTFGQRQSDSLAQHSHAIASYTSIAGTPQASTVQNGWNGTSSTFTGTTGGTETRPKNIALLACIKY